MNYNNLSLDSALSREFSKMGMTVKGLKYAEVLLVCAACAFVCVM